MRPKARTANSAADGHGLALRSMDRELLRVEEVALVLGVGRSTVFVMIRRHELPVIRIGRLVRVPRSTWDTQATDRPSSRASSG